MSSRTLLLLLLLIIIIIMTKPLFPGEPVLVRVAFYRSKAEPLEGRTLLLLNEQCHSTNELRELS